MTRVKVCGITSHRDAQWAVEAGVDALGFVFDESPRRVDPSAASQIIDALPTFVATVGVFMDHPLEFVSRVIAETGIGVVQLHGSENDDYCRCVQRPVIKRLAIHTNAGPQEIEEQAARIRVAGLLLDPGRGDGCAFDWHAYSDLSDVPTLRNRLIVAGGLTPENVTGAIGALEPYAVDVCSGVESAPGVKDIERLHAFVKAVRNAHATSDAE
jgi:phosphoribosylanthranilate isomerase